MTSFKILLFSCLFILNSCSNRTSEYYDTFDNWVFDEITEIKVIKKDSVDQVIIKDDTWIWFEDYTTWRLNYLLWKNENQIDLTKNISITVIHKDGDGIEQSVEYNPNDLKLLLDVFNYNEKFKNISEIFLFEFTPTEVMGIRNAYKVINDSDPKYDNFTRLFFELSRCDSICIEYNRIKLIAEMIYQVGMSDYFDYHKVSGSDILLKINKLLSVADFEEVKIL